MDADISPAGSSYIGPTYHAVSMDARKVIFCFALPPAADKVVA